MEICIQRPFCNNRSREGKSKKSVSRIEKVHSTERTRVREREKYIGQKTTTTDIVDVRCVFFLLHRCRRIATRRRRKRRRRRRHLQWTCLSKIYGISLFAVFRSTPSVFFNLLSLSASVKVFSISLHVDFTNFLFFLGFRIFCAVKRNFFRLHFPCLNRSSRKLTENI